MQVLALFKREPLFEEGSSTWMFDAFAWSLRNLDADVFHQQTILINPSNEHFSGEQNSAHGMAQLIFDHVQRYIGVSHWPCQLVAGNPAPQGAPRLPEQVPMRAIANVPSVQLDQPQTLQIGYDPNQLHHPQALIGSFALTFASYLASMAEEPIPGGQEMWPQLLEVVAVFLGFGIIGANSAYTYRRTGCGGSCQKTAVDRPAFLTAYEVCYLLAIFASLKGNNKNEVLPHLSKPLHSFYKKSLKDLQRFPEQMQMLAAIR